MVELALLTGVGDQAGANLLKVVEQARVFGARPEATFRQFVRWLRDNQRRPPRESDSASDTDDDIVRLMTVHAAKGLEFPIVLLANARAGNRTESLVVDRVSGAIDFRLGDKETIFRTPGYDAAAEHEGRHAEAENVRLFYVACTRARDYLLIPLFDAGGYAALAGGMLPVLGRAKLGSVVNGVWVYDTSSLQGAALSASVFRLEIGNGAEEESALRELAIWEARRRMRWRPSPQPNAAIKSAGVGEQSMS